jgi:hypothetical protein
MNLKALILTMLFGALCLGGLLFISCCGVDGEGLQNDASAELEHDKPTTTKPARARAMGGEGLDAGAELEHDAGDAAAELEHDAGDAAAELEHDAGAKLDHDAGDATWWGTWHVTRTSQPDVRRCTDAYGNTRDPSAVETWTIATTKAAGSKLGDLQWKNLGASAELVNAKVTGSVTFTSSSTFAGSLRIQGQSPTVDGSGWSTCWTTQTVQATR